MTATLCQLAALVRSPRETDSSSGRFNLSSNLSRILRLRLLLPGPALRPGPPPHCLQPLLQPVLLLRHHLCQRTLLLPLRCRPSRPHLLRLLSLFSLLSLSSLLSLFSLISQSSLHCSNLLLLSETSSTLTERGGSWPSSLDIQCFTTNLPTNLLTNLPTTPTRALPCLTTP